MKRVLPMALIVLGCGDSSGPGSMTNGLTLAVVGPASIALHGTAMYSIGATTAAGGEALPPEVTWLSDDPAIVRIEENGFAGALAIGETTIRAVTEDGQEVTREIAVTLLDLVVEPPSVRFEALGQEAVLTVTGYDATLAVVSDVPVMFESRTPDFLSVSESGVVSTVGYGFGSLAVIGGGLSRIVRVDVIRTAHGIAGVPAAVTVPAGTPVTIEMQAVDAEGAFFTASFSANLIQTSGGDHSTTFGSSGRDVTVTPTEPGTQVTVAFTRGDWEAVSVITVE